MGIKAVDSVWQQPIGGAKKLVLLAIAYHMKDGNYSAFPGLERISKMVSTDKRSAQRILRSLEKEGIITSEFRPGKSTIYRFSFYYEGWLKRHPDNLTTPDSLTTPTPDSLTTPGGDNLVLGGRQFNHPNLKNLNNNLNNEPKESPPPKYNPDGSQAPANLKPWERLKWHHENRSDKTTHPKQGSVMRKAYAIVVHRLTTMTPENERYIKKSFLEFYNPEKKRYQQARKRANGTRKN